MNPQLETESMKVAQDNTHQTVITTYEVNPGTFLDLLEELETAFETFLRKQDGFIAGAIHTNDAQTRIANYTQWKTREHFQAALRSDEMRAYGRKFSALSKTFAPVLYDVALTVSGGDSA
ncbi:MAG: antibiotic biosynthesis monooxygenase family protein [Paracoccaceae bacterium]